MQEQGELCIHSYFDFITKADAMDVPGAFQINIANDFLRNLSQTCKWDQIFLDKNISYQQRQMLCGTMIYGTGNDFGRYHDFCSWEMSGLKVEHSVNFKVGGKKSDQYEFVNCTKPQST